MRDITAIAGALFGILSVAFLGYTNFFSKTSDTATAPVVGFSHFVFYFALFAIILAAAARVMYLKRDEKPTLVNNMGFISGAFSLLGLGSLAFLG